MTNYTFLLYRITWKRFRVIKTYSIFFFSAGSLRVRSRDGQIIYSVYSLEEITNVIIPHFNKYLLNTKKLADYVLFKSAVEMMYHKEHLSSKGLQKIIGIKSAMNKGLSDKLKIDFPNVIPVKRPLVELPEILDYNWFGGFVDGEGCFHVQISYSKTTTTVNR